MMAQTFVAGSHVLQKFSSPHNLNRPPSHQRQPKRLQFPIQPSHFRSLDLIL